MQKLKVVTWSELDQEWIKKNEQREQALNPCKQGIQSIVMSLIAVEDQEWIKKLVPPRVVACTWMFLISILDQVSLHCLTDDGRCLRRVPLIDTKSFT